MLVFSNTKKTRINWSKSSKGPPRSSGLGSLVLWGETEGAGLV